MKVVVGLGNIGNKYKYTVHNMGFICIDKVAKELGVDFSKKKFNASIAETVVNGEKVVLVKPETYMNASGISVLEAVKKTNINVEKDLLIICDDVDLPEGKIRIREQGTAGTHNGLKNIVEHLKTTKFLRLRIGVGKAPMHMQTIDYVLSNIKDNKTIDDGNTRGSYAVLDFLNGENSQNLMQKYN